jgi:hypothetical protein
MHTHIYAYDASVCCAWYLRLLLDASEKSSYDLITIIIIPHSSNCIIAGSQVDKLGQFANEVTRVSIEVGTEG